MDAERPRQPWPDTFGWACYLACSWTWCIGMFLPVLLVRDFGAWGFVAFAVPNVVGAAGMGWVLTRGSSLRATGTHAVAVAAFSFVTILFQAAFALAVLQWLKQFAGVRLPWPEAILGAGVAAGLVNKSRWPAVAVYSASIGMAAVFFAGGKTHFDDVGPAGPSAAILYLAPVCAFGFSLCPYLDATFHRTVQHAASPRAAFTLGFCALFPVMILFTLAYSPLFEDRSARMATALAVCLHMLIQLGFTIGAHLRPLGDRGPRWSRWIGAAAAAIVLLVIVGESGSGRVRGFVPLQLSKDHEDAYRMFMAFYGLVFPAYVWLCMIPTRDGHRGTRGRSGQLKLLTWALAVAAAAPAFWMGFIERQTWWLAPGLAIVLLARLAVPRSAQGAGA